MEVLKKCNRTIANSVCGKEEINTVKIQRKTHSVPSSIPAAGQKNVLPNLLFNQKVKILPQDNNLIELGNKGFVRFPEKISEKTEKLTITELNSSEADVWLSENESLATNIFNIYSAKVFTKKFIISLNVSPIDSQYDEFLILHKKTKNSEWETKPISNAQNEGGEAVEFSNWNFGFFAVKTKLKSESLVLDPNGCLYLSKLSRYLSIRIPRKTVQREYVLTVKIFPLSLSQLKREINVNRAIDYIISVSDLFVMSTDRDATLEKLVSVKLPLPAQISDKSKFRVLEFVANQWNFCASVTKWTRTAVTISTHSFGKFCVVQMNKYENNYEIGMCINLMKLTTTASPLLVLVVLGLTKQKWVMRIYARSARGEAKLAESELNHVLVHKIKCPGLMLLHNTTIRFSIAGQVRNDDCDGLSLKFDPLLEDNYVDLSVTPEDSRCCQTTKIKLEVFDCLTNQPQIIESDVTIDEYHVCAYLDHLISIDNLEKKKRLQKEIADNRKKQLEEEKLRAEMARKMRREINLNRGAVSSRSNISYSNVSSKLKEYIEGNKTLHSILHTMESKILHYSSLRLIANYTTDILGLMRELGMPYSKIQSVYLDLYSTENLENFPYKLLLHWKYKTHNDDKKVEKIIEGLRKINDNKLANLVELCWRKNIELTNEFIQEQCFVVYF